MPTPAATRHGAYRWDLNGDGRLDGLDSNGDERVDTVLLRGRNLQLPPRRGRGLQRWREVGLELPLQVRASRCSMRRAMPMPSSRAICRGRRRLGGMVPMRAGRPAYDLNGDGRIDALTRLTTVS